MCEDIHFPFDTSKALGVFSACFTSFVTQKSFKCSTKHAHGTVDVFEISIFYCNSTDGVRNETYSC